MAERDENPWAPRPSDEPRPLDAFRPPPPEPRWRRLGRTLLAPLIALGLLLSKFWGVVLALFKLKVFTAAGSMLVSIAAYTTIWGWRFAVGFVFLLFVHEMGHALEAKRQGLPVSAPVFIPFLGAVILLKEMPKNAWREAQVALAGPIVGSLGAAAVWGVGAWIDSDLLRAIAFTGFFLNLFNLLPIVPLDGGRAVAALHPLFWAIGMAALIAAVLVWPNPILFIILVVAAFDIWQRWQNRHEAGSRRYYEVRGWQRVAVGATYFGLALALAVAMDIAHLEREL